MRAGEEPILFYCADCKEEHYATVLGGPIELSKSTALVKQKLCIECRRPTTGSIGQAGYYWPFLCQECKDSADGILRESLRTLKDIRTMLERVFAK